MTSVGRLGRIGTAKAGTGSALRLPGLMQLLTDFRTGMLQTRHAMQEVDANVSASARLTRIT